MVLLFIYHVIIQRKKTYVFNYVSKKNIINIVYFVIECIETAQPQVSAFSDETGEESAELGLPLEPVDSHETRTTKLRGLIMYPSHNQ